MNKWLALGLTAMMALALNAGAAEKPGPGKGKDKEKEKDPSAPAKPAKDPKDMNAEESEAAGLCAVCKKEFKPVYHYDLGGKTFHFDTRACQKSFADDPAKYGAGKK